ncbi:MAG: CRISPR-associated helicase Cas3' [Candidatus Calescibacterium sp.]|nr:CRISPR-associated helicase Cas3' [Candidatus Calescibacterium sp.]MDW8133320.1 CRISPR-associated helicase Cas3' [Candidatus Calescibacterium sp.]
MKSGLLSHPGKYLEDHSINTYLIAYQKFQDLKEVIKNILDSSTKLKDIDISDVEKLLRIMCLLHDLGKSTKFFQDYINGNKVDDKYKEHSFFSAYFVYFISKELINNNLLSFIAYFTVKKHHSNLSNVLDETFYKILDKRNVFKTQLESIDSEKLEIFSKNIYEYLNFEFNKKSLEKYLEKDIQKEFIRITNYLDRDSFCLYFLINILFSILIDSDKMEAIFSNFELIQKLNNQQNLNLLDPNFDKSIDKHIKKIRKNTAINKLRNSAYNETIKNLQKLINKGHLPKILCINLPTGIGKTFVNLSIGLKLYKLMNNCSRIIYCLPFLSIIDQTYINISNILTTDSRYIMKYHSLTELKYTTNEEFPYESILSYEQQKFLIEDWQSTIVITTFVQLFHTLISNYNSTIKRFNKLANSIIILDEIQAIDPKYWKIINQTLNFISEKMNCYIIVSTATYPYIFDNVSYLAKPDLYINKLDRFEVEINLNPISIQELFESFKNELNKNTKKNYLFIFNTIKSAKEFYKLIESDKKTFLATSVIPKQRIQRIEQIKKGRYKIVVSTQLIEAGVDIDFKVVVRDLAPLDSLNQSAGRCNRNFKKKGTFKIYNLIDEKNKNHQFSTYIYSKTLINKTEKILKNFSKTNEYNFFRLLEKYYSELKEEQIISQKESEKFIQSMKILKYTSNDLEGIDSFKLIEKDYPEIMIFIEIDKEAKEIWEYYQKLFNIKNIFERKQKFENIKSKFFEHIISIPKRIDNLPPFFNKEQSYIGFINNDDLPNYYDIETGYKTDIEGAIIL